MDSKEGIRSRANVRLKPIDTTRRSRGIEEEVVVKGCGVDGEPVSPSGVRLHHSDFNVHIVAIVGCKNKIMVDLVKENLSNSLLKNPRFSSITVVDKKDGGKMKWVKTKVDLDKHVITPKIPDNIESPDKFVEDYIYELSKSSVDRSKPMWEIHILNIKMTNPAAEGVGIYRIHHSLGDGTSLMSLLMACTRQVADPEALPTLPIKRQKERGFIRTVDFRFFLGFWWLIQLIWNTIVDVVLFLATTWFLMDTKTPISAPPDSMLNPRRIVHKTIFKRKKLII